MDVLAGADNRPTRLLEDPQDEYALLSSYVKSRAVPERALDILEAGCGQKWLLDLDGIDHRVTGVDVSRDALDLRVELQGDLDEAVLGDLETVELPHDRFDVIYSSFVLEHVRDAPQVLDNFIRWLRPGGAMILRVPDRDSVFGFLTRLSPHWVHVLYKRHVAGNPNSGKPGYPPFPTLYHPVVSRRRLRDFCAQRGLNVRAEYLSNYYLRRLGGLRGPMRVAGWLLHIVSAGRLAHLHNNVTLVIEKPDTAGR